MKTQKNVQTHKQQDQRLFLLHMFKTNLYISVCRQPLQSTLHAHAAPLSTHTAQQQTATLAGESRCKLLLQLLLLLLQLLQLSLLPLPPAAAKPANWHCCSLLLLLLLCNCELLSTASS
jgi:hypothetical protein